MRFGLWLMILYLFDDSIKLIDCFDSLMHWLFRCDYRNCQLSINSIRIFNSKFISFLDSKLSRIVCFFLSLSLSPFLKASLFKRKQIIISVRLLVSSLSQLFPSVCVGVCVCVCCSAVYCLTRTSKKTMSNKLFSITILIAIVSISSIESKHVYLRYRRSLERESDIPTKESTVIAQGQDADNVHNSVRDFSNEIASNEKGVKDFLEIDYNPRQDLLRFSGHMPHMFQSPHMQMFESKFPNRIRFDSNWLIEFDFENSNLNFFFLFKSIFECLIFDRDDATNVSTDTIDVWEFSSTFI